MRHVRQCVMATNERNQRDNQMTHFPFRRAATLTDDCHQRQQEEQPMSTETFTTGDFSQGIVEKTVAEMTGEEAATALLLQRQITEHWERTLDKEGAAYRRGKGTKYDLCKLQDHAEEMREKLERLGAQIAERLPEPEDGTLISATWIIEFWPKRAAA
jgi:hypothetical protein